MDKATTQVKFTIESDLVDAFRARCAAEGISMTAEIRRFMRDCQPTRTLSARTLTRPYRRKAVSQIIQLLTDVRDKESEYRDNIPEAFTERYDAANEACERIDEAISNLEDAY